MITTNDNFKRTAILRAYLTGFPMRVEYKLAIHQPGYPPFELQEKFNTPRAAKQYAASLGYSFDRSGIPEEGYKI